MTTGAGDATRAAGAAAGANLAILRDEIRSISAYHVAPSSGMVKLDAMENPYGLPPALGGALAQRLAALALNRYPPADPREFKLKLARAIGMPAGQSLMLGNGSDELIHLVIQACARPGAAVLSPWPSFAMYDLTARFDGCRFVGVPLGGGFSLDVVAMRAAIALHRPAVVFIAYPNNPTGNLFDRAAIGAVLEAAPGLVVIDEAYLPFAQDTFLPQLPDHPNLLVLRTLSKLGLAGIRLGYLCGDPQWIEQFDKVRPPYNVGVLPLAVADFMLDHLDLLDAQAALVRAERARLTALLRALPGVEVFPSAANFLLFKVREPVAVFAGLRQRGILIKDLSRSHPMLSGCLRATVGTAEENDRFMAALRPALAAAQALPAAQPPQAPAR